MASLWREVFDRVALLVKYGSIIHCVQYYGFEFTLCIGPSMIPTFNPIGDIIIIEHPSVMLGHIKRGDVVIAQSPSDPSYTVCKRVLAVGGDVVKVDGIKPATKIPQGYVWLQGDNAHNSTDSRSYGPVPYALLRGKVVCRIFPLSQFGPIESKIVPDCGAVNITLKAKDDGLKSL